MLTIPFTAGVVIGFDPTSFSVVETDGSATFTIRVLEGMLDRTTEVLFSTSDGSATSVAPADFVPVTDAPLQFDSSTLSQTFTVTIVNDDILENPEEFFGMLTTLDDSVDIRPDVQTSTVTILEEDGDDCKC